MSDHLSSVKADYADQQILLRSPFTEFVMLESCSRNVKGESRSGLRNRTVHRVIIQVTPSITKLIMMGENAGERGLK